MQNKIWCAAVLSVGMSMSLSGCEEAWSRGRLAKPRGRDEGAMRDAGTVPDAQAAENAYGRYVLVDVAFRDPANPYLGSHEVRVLDAATDEALPDGLRLQTAPESGVVHVPQLPAGVAASLHVVGDESLVDSVLLNAPSGSGRLPVGNAGLMQILPVTAEYAPHPERAALWGRVLWGPEEDRMVGPVGCATVSLEDESGGAQGDIELRYVEELLPQKRFEHTSVTSGQFLLGNMPTGAHRLKVSVDGGETSIGEASFVASRSRNDALGPIKDILYVLDVHILAEEDPTPRRCR